MADYQKLIDFFKRSASIIATPSSSSEEYTAIVEHYVIAAVEQAYKACSSRKSSAGRDLEQLMAHLKAAVKVDNLSPGRKEAFKAYHDGLLQAINSAEITLPSQLENYPSAQSESPIFMTPPGSPSGLPVPAPDGQPAAPAAEGWNVGSLLSSARDRLASLVGWAGELRDPDQTQPVSPPLAGGAGEEMAAPVLEAGSPPSKSPRRRSASVPVRPLEGQQQPVSSSSSLAARRGITQPPPLAASTPVPVNSGEESHETPLRQQDVTESGRAQPVANSRRTVSDSRRASINSTATTATLNQAGFAPATNSSQVRCPEGFSVEKFENKGDQATYTVTKTASSEAEGRAAQPESYQVVEKTGQIAVKPPLTADLAQAQRAIAIAKGRMNNGVILGFPNNTAETAAMWLRAAIAEEVKINGDFVTAITDQYPEATIVQNALADYNQKLGPQPQASLVMAEAPVAAPSGTQQTGSPVSSLSSRAETSPGPLSGSLGGGQPADGAEVKRLQRAGDDYATRGFMSGEGVRPASAPALSQR